MTLAEYKVEAANLVRSCGWSVETELGRALVDRIALHLFSAYVEGERNGVRQIMDRIKEEPSRFFKDPTDMSDS